MTTWTRGAGISTVPAPSVTRRGAPRPFRTTLRRPCSSRRARAGGGCSPGLAPPTPPSSCGAPPFRPTHPDLIPSDLCPFVVLVHDDFPHGVLSIRASQTRIYRPGKVRHPLNPNSQLSIASHATRFFTKSASHHFCLYFAAASKRE